MTKSPTLFSIDSFSRQVTLAHNRISKLLGRVTIPTAQPVELLPDALKELGIVVEELEIALEELQQQNEALSESLESAKIFECHYQDWLHFAPDAYLLTNSEGAIQEANPAASELLGMASDSLVGQSLSRFVEESDRPNFRIRMLQAKQTEKPQTWQFHLKPCGQSSFQANCWMKSVWQQGRMVSIRWRLARLLEALPSLTPIGQNYWAEMETQLLAELPIHTFNRGENISLDPDIVWLVMQGVVKLTTLTANNEEVLLGLAQTDVPFGAHLTSLPLYQAIPLCPVQLLAIPLKTIKDSPQLTHVLAPKVAHRLKQTEALLAISGERRVMDRLCLFLKFLKEDFGEPTAEGVRLTIRLTHEDFASACCTTRVTMTRMLGQLQKRKKLIPDKTGHLILLRQAH